MSMSNHAEKAYLKWELTNVGTGRFASVTATAGGLAANGVAGSVYFALHSADPGEDGAQSASEATYGGATPYARVGLARDPANWSIVDPSPPTAPTEAVLNVDIDFPEYSSGASLTFTHWSIGNAPNTVDGGVEGNKILRKGQFATPLVVTAGSTPRIAAGDLIIRQD